MELAMCKQELSVDSINEDEVCDDRVSREEVNEDGNEHDEHDAYVDQIKIARIESQSQSCHFETQTHSKSHLNFDL